MNHAEWVASRLAALPDALPFADGASVPIGDVPHRIRHVPNSRGGAWLQDGELHVSGAPEFLRRRVTDFLRAGVSLVWVVDPEAETLTVYQPDKAPRVLTVDEEVTGEDVLPGFV